MRKLAVFNQLTLDGYFGGVNSDISWAHKDTGDIEWNADGLTKKLSLKPARTRTFGNGNALLCYEPMA